MAWSACQYATPPRASASRAREHGRQVPAAAAQVVETDPRLVQVAALLPEPPQRERDAHRELGIRAVGGPHDRRPQVVVLALEAVEPAPLIGARELRRRLLRQVEECPAAALLDVLAFAARGEHLGRVLADRIEHHVALRRRRPPRRGAGSGRRASRHRRGRRCRPRSPGRRRDRPHRARSRRRTRPGG